MSLSRDVTEWFAHVDALLANGRLEYEEVKALSDQGYALMYKLKALAVKNERYALKGGSFAEAFEKEAKLYRKRAEEIRDTIDELWEAFKRR